MRSEDMFEDMFEEYVQNTIELVEKNRSDESKYVKNNIPDEVIPYRINEEEEMNDGAK